jgi:hypothetical protein
MKNSDSTAGDRGVPLETLAAEFTTVAHAVALRQGVGGKWLDLQLDLWRSLTETVTLRGREWPWALGPTAYAVWWEGLVPELTEVAYRTTQRHSVRGSLREVKSALDQAFRSAIRTLAKRRNHAGP